MKGYCYSILFMFLLFVVYVKSVMNRPGYRTLENKDISQNNSFLDNLKIEMLQLPVLHPGTNEILYVVTNNGSEDEYVRLNISDNKGYIRTGRELEFALPIGSTKEIPVRIEVPLINGTIIEPNPDVITLQARGKRSNITKRSIYLPGSDLEYGGQTAPFCYDRYVTGNCRYRTDPEYCFNYEWTAYAIIQNLGGFTTLRSIPEGLYVPPFSPGSRERIRVWVKTSCCTPFVEIISSEGFFAKDNICVVDVRELQSLHWAEITAIVAAIVLLLIIIIVIAVMLIRKNRAQTILVGHHSRSQECISRE